MMTDQIDTKVVGKLAEILDQHNLTELEYESEGCRICLTRESAQISAPIAAPVQMMSVAPTPVVATLAASEKEETEAVVQPEEVDESNNPNAVKSPMVGVVYLSPDPSKPAYVKVGGMVAEGDTVCLIEAMKTFNPVKAHKGGRVTKILVQTGDPIEYGQPLVVIE